MKIVTLKDGRVYRKIGTESVPGKDNKLVDIRHWEGNYRKCGVEFYAGFTVVGSGDAEVAIQAGDIRFELARVHCLRGVYI